MSKYLGDFSASSIIDFKFTTFRPSTGAPFTLAGTPVVSVYKDNDVTQTTTGVVLTVDFDGVTGLNHVRVTTTDAFYANGSEFECVITTGTVDSVSVVGSCIGRFTLRSQASLYPTTAGNTLDVNVNGEAGVDWGNVGNQGSTVGLAATTVFTTTNVSNAVTVGTINANVITATAIANDAITAAKIATDAIDADAIANSAITIRLSTDGTASEGRIIAGSVANDVWNAQVATYATAGSNETLGTDTYGTKVMRTVVANRPSSVNTANGHVVASMSNGAITATAIATDAITAAKFADDALVIQSAAALGNKIRFASDAITSTVIATDAITNAELAATAVQEIWDYNVSAYVTAGLAGTYLKNAGAAGNPWLTDISSTVTYPTATTAGGYMRSAYVETNNLLTTLINMPLNVWTSIITSDSTTYGDYSSYSMVDVMALLAKGYCAIFGTVLSTPAPTVNNCRTSLTGFATGAFDEQTIVFLKGSSIQGACTLIQSSNATGQVVFDEQLHQAPVIGDEFMILPIHVHPRSKIADKLLGRSIAGGADGGRTVTSALRPLRNRTSITGNVLTVTDETDNLLTGVAWTANLTTSPTADPVTGIDPV
jgi:hypothetical protein